jgi:hypothetical protein
VVRTDIREGARQRGDAHDPAAHAVHVLGDELQVCLAPVLELLAARVGDLKEKTDARALVQRTQHPGARAADADLGLVACAHPALAAESHV